MGIGASLTTFSSGTTISSSAVNANFSSLNNSGLPNDSGAISTDGSGNMTVVGLIVGSSGVIFPNNTALKMKNTSGTVRNVMLVDANNSLTLKSPENGGQFTFTDQGGTIVAGMNVNTRTFQMWNSLSSTLRDVLYVTNGFTSLQIADSGAGKILFKDQTGANKASIDNNGNLRCAGTVTASVTP